MAKRPAGIRRKSLASAKAQSKKSDECFVIAPFRGAPDAYYEKIFRPATRNAGLVPRRADDIFISREIVKDIWDAVRAAKVVIADLTGRNPNVLYELGLAHAIGTPAILVAQNVDELPFDLRHYRTIIYNTADPDWARDLRGNITKFIKETTSDPAGAVPTPFLKERSVRGRPTVSAAEKRILGLQRRIDALESSLSSTNRYATMPQFYGGGGSSGSIVITSRDELARDSTIASSSHVHAMPSYSASHVVPSYSASHVMSPHSAASLSGSYRARTERKKS